MNGPNEEGYARGSARVILLQWAAAFARVRSAGARTSERDLARSALGDDSVSFRALWPAMPPAATLDTGCKPARPFEQYASKNIDTNINELLIYIFKIVSAYIFNKCDSMLLLAE